MSGDNRKEIRMPLDVEVNFSTNAIARTKNISKGGICLLSEEPIETGRIHTLSFFLPDTGERIKAFAKIVWTKQVSDHVHEHGLEFWDINEDDKIKIRTLLDKKIQES